MQVTCIIRSPSARDVHPSVSELVRANRLFSLVPRIDLIVSTLPLVFVCNVHTPPNPHMRFLSLCVSLSLFLSFSLSLSLSLSSLINRKLESNHVSWEARPPSLVFIGRFTSSIFGSANHQRQGQDDDTLKEEKQREKLRVL